MRPAARTAACRTALACAPVLAALLAGCASRTGGGRDGPPANPPPNLASVPDAEPRIEAIRSGGPNKPYAVLGRSYVPLTDDRPYSESGLASWYGRAFHGRPTSSGEPYDMYAMTAAHTTLPIPSYARVSNPANGRSVIVRVNDHGPFHDGRVIDLSYTAALKLDLLRGVAPVTVERITQQDIRAGLWRRGGDAGTAVARTAPAVVVPAAAVQPVALASNTPPITPPVRLVQADNWTIPLAVSGVPPAAPTPAPVAAAAVLAPSAPPAEPVQTQPVQAAPAAIAAQELPPLEPAATVPAAPPPPPPPPPPAEPATSAGFWLQFGAFGRPEGAEQLRRQIAPAVQPLAPRLAVFADGGLHRLQAGPFDSRDAALRAAAQLRGSLPAAPVLIERR
ncbi:septal ring lytic transglycosylase RlpA family protein [Xylophilus sp.]|uniref:septal ring lytic transglycosylase RlpA family protein n=1 Tax=Xylophilus sp. TaxID=2653893 RepID=UPI0013BB6191|nr:septal ring lytic transglycosylase RlpA family protein [Xylophilus sp.]KAF1048200.1 MAG: Endolytic peptidoglycan transglycosylase RlpA [Xylophilus sp.]